MDEIDEYEQQEALEEIKKNNRVEIWEGLNWWAGIDFKAIASGNSSRSVTFAAIRFLRENSVDVDKISFVYLR